MNIHDTSNIYNNVSFLQKQMSRRNPKPITQFATASKGHKIPCATETTRPDFEINHVYVLESEIKNLETKISAYLPSMNNKVSDLHEVWVIKQLLYFFLLPTFCILIMFMYEIEFF